MEQRRHPSPTDFLLIGINPFLIMLLVGSLVFFLLEALYQGQYDGRLRVIFALFVMAIVCIARISIDEGKGHATLFAIPLALVVGLAMSRFVEYSGALAGFKTFLNWGLMGLVWWAAHQLTWDCTVIDEAADASGQGLFQQLGWRKETDSNAATGPAIDEPEGLTNHDAPETPDAPWWSTLRQRLMRKHTPGVWVVYFSLAALPIFGFGQGFIGGQDVEGQSRAQRYLALYVGSGLALLVSTSFLNLRRYLRKRHVDVSSQITFRWLAVGAVLILAVLAVSWMLPGPGAARWANSIAFSPQLNPSKWGVGNDGAPSSQGKPAPSAQQSGGQSAVGRSAVRRSAVRRSAVREVSSREVSSQGVSSQVVSSRVVSSQVVSSQVVSSQGVSSQGVSSREVSSREVSSREVSSRRSAVRRSAVRRSAVGRSAVGRSAVGAQQVSSNHPVPAAKRRLLRRPVQRQSRMRSNSTDRSPSSLGRLMESAAGALAWIIRIVALIAILVAIWLFRATLLSAIREFIAGLRSWWAGLFGGSPRSGASDASLDGGTTMAPPPACARLRQSIRPGDGAATSGWGVDSLYVRGARCLGSRVRSIARNSRNSAGIR